MNAVVGRWHAVLATSMYDNRPNETKSLYRDVDGDGRQLEGRYNDTVTFARGQEPPVRGFCSLAGASIPTQVRP